MIQKSPPRQRGAVLVIGLLLLVILTVLGTTAMQSTSLQERMAGSARDGNLAFQAAEAALRDAEQHINRTVAPFEPFRSSGFNETIGRFTSNPGLYNSQGRHGQFCLCNSTASPALFALGNLANLAQCCPDSVVVDETKSQAYGSVTGATALPNVVAQPRYLIELLLASCTGTEPSALFRITARAQGANDNTVVILQSRYRRGLSCGSGASEAPTGSDDIPSI